MAPLSSRSPFLPSFYHERQILDAELHTVWTRNWVFVGFTHDVSAHQDNLALQLGGESIVITNCNGELRAYLNVCSHRGAQIKANGTSRGPLRCPYHGWTYDCDGMPTGIPRHQENFGFTDIERNGLALRPFAVAAVGIFIFVRIASSGPSLPEFLGETNAALLAEVSKLPLQKFADSTETWNGNWKLGVENTLESYHLGLVHAESLAQALSGSGEHHCDQRHSRTRHPLLETSEQWWRKVAARGRYSGIPGYTDYRHYLIYPNLCLGLTYGTLLSVQQFRPVDPNHCDLRFRLYLPEPGDGKTCDFNLSIQDYLRDFNRRVLDEDREVVEITQQGTQFTNSRAWIGAKEARVSGFEEAVMADFAWKDDTPSQPKGAG